MLDDSILDELDALLEAGTIFETDEYRVEEEGREHRDNDDFPQKLEEYMQLRRNMESFELISDDIVKKEESTELQVQNDPINEALKAEHRRTLHELRAFQNLFQKCVAYTTDERSAMRIVYAV